MTTARPSIQTATDRRAADAQLRELVAKFAPGHERAFGAVRRALQKRLPTAHELVYEYRDNVVVSYSPNERGYEGVFALRADADGVKLYFNRGKGLPDPEKLLQGSGKTTRWIALESASALTRPAVVGLIDAALARNDVPFATNGRGTVVVRSTAAQKRSGKRSS